MQLRFNRANQVPVDILVVCTGNVCRSPYIAAQLRHHLRELRIESAGTSALVGETPDDLVRRALAHRDVPSDDLAPARSVTSALARGAHLIVAATTAQRARVLTLDRTAIDRAFTLKELVRVLSPLGPNLGTAGVAAAASAAAHDGDTRDHEDDLADPFGLEWPAYETMAAEVDAALTVLIPALREG